MSEAFSLVAPADVPARETAAFLTAHAARRAGNTLLEVGCGTGEVALALADRGFAVTAVDGDAQAVAQARALGVNAHHARWPDFPGGPFATVAFTRSLHHIHPLAGALQRAAEVLQPGGVLLLEDFAFEEAGPATARWFVERLRSAPLKLMGPAPGEFAWDLLAAADPETHWREGRDHHDVHTFAHLLEALGERFKLEMFPPEPYLYRYLVAVAPATPAGAAWVERFLAEERAAIAAGTIDAMGRRAAARPREADA